MKKPIYALGTIASLVGTLGLSALVARRLVTPAPYTAKASVRESSASDVTLTATRDTRLPGTYRLQRGPQNVPVGQIISAADGAVRREAAAVIEAGEWAWDAIMYDTVDDIPASDEPLDGGTHVIHVHGQSLGPRQVLRGITVWRELGASSEILDFTKLPARSLDASASDEVVARVRAARERGATRVVLQGWSAGALAASVAASRVDVDAIIGVSPLLSVKTALRGAVGAAHLPRFVGSAAFRITKTPGLSRLGGAPTALTVTDWRDTPGVPTLLIHSRADTLVSGSDVTTTARRHGAEVVSFETAPHTLEWNEDPQRWDEAVRTFAVKHSLAR